jgi:nanoRNase/pAp phosphatase (c-di-AMP/oligoRNAs hydrolase)
MNGYLTNSASRETDELKGPIQSFSVGDIRIEGLVRERETPFRDYVYLRSRFDTSRGRMYVLISHKKDLDGLASAALSLRYVAKHKGKPYAMSLKDYTDEDPVVEEKFLDLQNGRFIITDLSTNIPRIEVIVEKFRTLKSQNNEISWFDHHPSSDQIRFSLSAVVDLLDLRPSYTVASEITYQDLYVKNGIDDAHALLLSKLGHDSDLLELKHSVTPKLMSIIDYSNYLDRSSIISPRLLQFALQLAFPRIEADEDGILEPYQDGLLEEYEELKARERSKILADSEVFQAGKHSVVLFRFPRLFSGTQASMIVLEHSKADVSIGLSDSGEGSVRRTVDDVSCREIAELFGGGGHDFAAGFPSDGGKLSGPEFELYKGKVKKAVIRLLS